MLTQYHIEIMFSALKERFSARALAEVINANIYQDRIAGQFGHDEFHFDNNAFQKSYAYIEEQRALTQATLKRREVHAARAAFGRMTHTLQDFYAHSNYITLWLDRFAGHTPPPSSEVDPLDPDLIQHPDLRSGRTYYPFEFLYFLRGTRQFSLRILPHDSHAWMNLDSPAQGFKFEYAMQAAIKRTVSEFEKTTAGCSDEMCQLLMDG
jgi:hypothetical protein